MVSIGAVSGWPDMTASRVGSSAPNSTGISRPPFGCGDETAARSHPPTHYARSLVASARSPRLPAVEGAAPGTGVDTAKGAGLRRAHPETPRRNARPMKMTNVQATWVHVPIPYERQHTSDFGRIASFDSVIVKVDTAEGLVGWGEAKAGVGSA